ncbi:MAG: hypothetical protein R3251_03070 [Candidatus Spechtbacterales bacterium]|nr:hypothetical protein [Candidatus Spechtbacterales bacterium]
MTCIAAIVEQDTVWMGCDTIMTSGGYARGVDTKIIQRDGIMMGFAGRVRDINLLKFGFEIPPQDKNLDDYEYMATVFSSAVRERLKEFGAAKIDNSEETGRAYAIVAHNKRLYDLSYDFSVSRVEGFNFDALGSGRGEALGSLYTTRYSGLTPEERIRQALSAAEEFTTSVRGPFVIESIKQ